MLTNEDLIKNFSAERTNGFILELSYTLCEQNTDLTGLIDLTFHADKHIAFCAAWLLDTVMRIAPNII